MILGASSSNQCSWIDSRKRRDLGYPGVFIGVPKASSGRKTALLESANQGITKFEVEAAVSETLSFGAYFPKTHSCSAKDCGHPFVDHLFQG